MGERVDVPENVVLQAIPCELYCAVISPGIMLSFGNLILKVVRCRAGCNRIRKGEVFVLELITVSANYEDRRKAHYGQLDISPKL